ncbi:FAD/NAD(P)-binding domain-containing protein [Dendrothele bispora CBS 962.96]|uniref:FAD/NAD(P)-binding domain-containing protein n=1 Tax=Dendrothele bispora (strain CBS 962.96) TaxID=1314807 RepID=A0A4S8MQ94_DENBC|nr:FAD/NAD(P)-binding domain-containing protein [Dendrothele bispora CBS 962.96]
MQNDHWNTANPRVLYGGRKARQKLHIVIVGGGIGGLAAAFCLGQAGHEITVLESAPHIGEIGAGIQICPNLSRLLIRWGLGEQLEAISGRDRPKAFTFCRYSSGEKVGMSILGAKIERQHGAPWYVVHRRDLYDMLFSLAKPFMDLRLNSKVMSVDPHGPVVVLETGSRIPADLVIGCDGIKSMVRNHVLGHERLPLAVPTGDVAYRAIVPTEAMMSDPDLRYLVENPGITCWIGPGKHLVGYCMSNGKQYNMVGVKPDDGSTYSWTAEGDPAEMQAGYAGWEPRVEKLLSKVDIVLKSKLIICSPLSTWTHSNGCVTLLGDACHPMLPYRAQGSAMAIEDAAVLGNLFSRLSGRHDIPGLLRAYQDIRLNRTASAQAASYSNRENYHLEDGAEQEARDALMKAAMLKELDAEADENKGNPNAWSDKAKSAETFDYDADAAVENWWEEHRGRINLLKL